MSTSLYRYFNAEGQLLYVGISLSALDRMRDHASYSGWFKQVANMTVEQFDNAADAKAAEKSAIEREQPLHNVVWNGIRKAREKKESKRDSEIEKRIDRARKLVKERTGEQAKIARDIGVSYQWLRKFASGELVEPSAIKFEHLEQWLADN